MSKTCPLCLGRGRLAWIYSAQTTCSACDGYGRVEMDENEKREIIRALKDKQNE